MRTKHCPICNQGYFIKEVYGLNWSDQYSTWEEGHLSDCVYYNIDPIDRKYLPMEGFVKN